MKHKLLFIVSLLSIIGFASQVHSVNFTHETSDLPADERVVWGTLENGLRYAIMPHNEPPERVSLRLYVDAGSLMETDEQQGIAHYLEHMAFNGTTHFKPGELVEYFQRIGMAFGADTNAHTSFKETVYKLELPENTNDFLEEGMRVMRDYADGMLLLPEEIDRERGVILAEKRSRDSASYRTFLEYWKFLFPDSLIPKRFPIGVEETINNMSEEDFRAFYSKWYTVDRMALVVVGDVEPDKIAKMVDTYFSSMAKNENPISDPDLGAVSKPGITAKLHSESEASATEIGILTIRPYGNQKDESADRIQDMITSAANRIISRRFEKLAKKEEAPFSKGSSYFYDYLNFFEMGGIEIQCQPEQWEQALFIAEQELRKALEFGFTQAEIDEAKANILNEYEQAVKRAPTRKSRDLSSGIAKSISRKDVYTSPETNLKIAQAAMSKLNPETAFAAIKNLWSDENRFLFISGNLTLESGDERIKTAYLESQKVKVEAPKEEVTKQFAYTDFGAVSTIVDENYHEDLNVHQIRYENNVRLNIKQTDFQANTVLVGLRFGGGELTLPEDKPGLALLASAIFTAGGLKEHSMDELERITAGRTVGVSFSVGEDAFTMSGQTNADDLLLQLQLMAAYLMEPGYRPEAKRLAEKSFEKMYVKVKHTLEGIVGNEVSRFLASGDYRFGTPEKEALLALTTEDVEQWLANALKTSYLEISVVGDVSPEQVKAAIGKTFAALPERAKEKKGYSAQRKVKFPSAAKTKTFTYETKIPRAASIVYWPTTDIWDISHTRRMSMLSRVFDDRLRVEIRETLGEAYSPYATSRPSETYEGYGKLYTYAVADPENTGQISDIVLNISESLLKQGVTQDELDRALKPLLNALEEYVRNNSYWLSRVLMRSQENPSSLNWARTMVDDYKNITVEELNAVAKQYMGKDKGLSVQVLPQEES